MLTPGDGAAVSGGHPGRVDVRDLSWRPYGRREPVLRGIDLVIPAGQRLLLVGPSGSGKSTLLRGLAGVLEVADSGERTGTVLLDGVDPGARAGAVGLVLQEPGAGVVSATIGRDVAFGLENTGMPRAAMPARVDAALTSVHLTMPRDTPTHALSGGEQQRLALAGALALEPSLLLLDEPTAMLDPENAASVREVVAEVTGSRGLTTVVVEHRLGPWVEFADRLVVLDDQGRIVADGDPHEVLDTHAEALAAQGIWVPGVPDPEPRPVPAGHLRTRAPGGPHGRPRRRRPARRTLGPQPRRVDAHQRGRRRAVVAAAQRRVPRAGRSLGRRQVDPDAGAGGARRPAGR